MIVYAFYGLGKTALAKKSSIFKDIDDEFVFSRYKDIHLMDGYYKKLASSGAAPNGNIYLVNLRSAIIDKDIYISFLPENAKMIEDRLRNRGVSEGFIKEICNQDVLNGLYKRFPNAIIIKHYEYLSDFSDYIISHSVNVDENKQQQSRPSGSTWIG